jgi:hypothetical protein
VGIDEKLREELEASDGSFLLSLRTDLTWDPSAFDRLIAAMLEVVQARDPEEPIPRWMAQGFWFVDWFVKEWSQHPNFPRPHSAQYYQRAYERLHDLAFYLFMGTSPYQDGKGFEALRSDE